MANRSKASLAKQWQKEFELTPPPEQRPLLFKLAHFDPPERDGRGQAAQRDRDARRSTSGG
jgi:hypothetical protein